jgi:hypothetical protein
MIDLFTRTDKFITSASDAWAGYFKVDQKIFYSKIDAILYASKTDFDVTFHFHDDVYGKVNWTQPVYTPLNQLYRQRAQQLRDKYDYLVLHYSGGSDSHNILRTFLDNKIRLDEVFVRWPVEATKRFCPVATRNDDPRNMLSEWELTILPQLEWLRSNYPDVKVTIKDTSDVNVLDVLSEEGMLNAAGGLYVNPGSLIRHTVTSDVEVSMLAKHQKVASIYGANKPCLLKRGSDLYTFFIDYAARNGGGTGGGQTKNVELFYWTPDMPQILVEQCHVILNYFKNNPDLQPFLENKQFTEESYWLNLAEIMKMLLYSNWDYSSFQVRKVAGWVWFNDYDDFMRVNYGREKFMDKWRSVNMNLNKSIASRFKRYVNGQSRGIEPLATKLYYVGKLF